MAKRHVSYKDANGFLQKCFAKPERMRLLCSTKAEREGGDSLAVAVEIAPGGPVVEVGLFVKQSSPMAPDLKNVSFGCSRIA